MDWFWNNFGGVITTVLAVYGAFLSSLNFWHTRKRDKKELYIKSEIKTESSSSDKIKDKYAIITIVNKSLRPIAIDKIGFKYAYSFGAKSLKHKNFETGAFINHKKLDTSEVFYYYFNFKYSVDTPEDTNSNSMLKAIPYVIDTEGERYKGEPFKHPANFVFYLR